VLEVAKTLKTGADFGDNGDKALPRGYFSTVGREVWASGSCWKISEVGRKLGKRAARAEASSADGQFYLE
jgi:hypothetical protein